MMGTPRRALAFLLGLLLILSTAPAVPADRPAGDDDDHDSWRNPLAMPPLALPEEPEDALEASFVRPEIAKPPDPPRALAGPLYQTLPCPLSPEEAVSLGLWVILPDRLYLLPLGCGGALLLVAPDPETWMRGQLDFALACGNLHLR